MIIRYPVSYTWKLYDSDKLNLFFKGLLAVKQSKLEICLKLLKNQEHF